MLTWDGTMEELPSPIRRASKPAFSIALINSSLEAFPAGPKVGMGQNLGTHPMETGAIGDVATWMHQSLGFATGQGSLP